MYLTMNYTQQEASNLPWKDWKGQIGILSWIRAMTN